MDSDWLRQRGRRERVVEIERGGGVGAVSGRDRGEERYGKVSGREVGQKGAWDRERVGEGDREGGKKQ